LGGGVFREELDREHVQTASRALRYKKEMEEWYVLGALDAIISREGFAVMQR